ncbi:ATP-binding protein [Chloroflexota bacterium]
MHEIITIRLALPLRLGNANCYLIKTETGYILIDTGISNKHTDLERELERASCKPGNLGLIIITHGDFDHTGNAAFISKKFGSIIAMHYDDSGMVEHGNMFWNRKKGNIILRMIINRFFGFNKSKRFKPDLYVEDEFNFSEYGFNAKALHIPGHSKGSIGILTMDGDLFCGDLFANKDDTNQPELNSVIDDFETANKSADKIRGLKVNTVYSHHTAVSLGVLACQLGEKVRFYTATALVNELLEAQDQHTLGKRLAQLARMGLLIVDEVGFVPFTPEGARLLFQAFSERYLRGSLLITSNLEFSRWLEVFGDERLTGALLDRLTHHCHVLEFNGGSYRFKESLRQREEMR